MLYRFSQMAAGYIFLGPFSILGVFIPVLSNTRLGAILYVSIIGKLRQTFTPAVQYSSTDSCRGVFPLALVLGFPASAILPGSTIKVAQASPKSNYAVYFPRKKRCQKCVLIWVRNNNIINYIPISYCEQ